MYFSFNGKKITINPLSQISIDAAKAKAKAPGAGIGPAVVKELMLRMSKGRINKGVSVFHD